MSKLNVKLPEKLSKIFTTKKKVILLKGGRASGKSWGVAIFLLIKALSSKTRVVCTRETAAAMDRSSYTLIADTIERSGLHGFKLTERDIKAENGSELGFMGLLGRSKADTRARIKGLEGTNYLWVEEAENISIDMVARLHSTIRGNNADGELNKIIYTFNPFLDPDPVMEYYSNSDEVEVIHIDYIDNPFCPQDIIDHADKLKATDYDEYSHVYLGEPKRNSEAVIFSGKFSTQEFDTPSDVERFYYGADWGFAKDPTTLIRSYIIGNTLFIDHEAHGVGIDIDKTPALFNKIPRAKTNLIYADCARPETISYIRRAGYNIEGAKKWGGSIEDGITYLRGFDDIIIHPRCKKTYEEFSLYRYKEDTLTGEIYPKPIDDYNHMIDALRYAHSERIRMRGSNELEVPTVSLFT